MTKTLPPNPNLKKDKLLNLWYRTGKKLVDHDQKEDRPARGPHAGIAGFSKAQTSQAQIDEDVAN